MEVAHQIKKNSNGELRISSLNKQLTCNCKEQKVQMEYLTRTVWLISILCTCHCDRLRNFDDRLRFLERRISAESEFRSHDTSAVFRRLDEMDLLINTTLEETFEKMKSGGVCGNSRTVDEEGLQQEYRKLQSDIKILRLAFQSQKLYSLEIESKYTELESNFEQLKRKSEEKERHVMVTAQKKDSDEIEKKFAQLRKENAHLVKLALDNREKNSELEGNFEQLKRKTEAERQVKEKDSDEIEKKFAELRQENVRLVEALKVLEVRLQKDERIREHLEFSSCKDAYDKGFTSSGRYYLRINDEYNKVLVYCDQETDNGGWTVFQRRKDGSEDFYRDWDDYRDGFGDVDGEFWLGNKYIYALTGSRSRELRIDLGDFEGHKAFAKYRTFRIESEVENYTIAISEYEGNDGDSLKAHNGQGFTTKDRDNDRSEENNCAVLYTGAWWHEDCHNSNLNGHYYQGDNSPKGQGVTWHFWKNSSTYSLKFVEMKLR